MLKTSVDPIEQDCNTYDSMSCEAVFALLY